MTPIFRPFRADDLMAVRTDDPYDEDEYQVVLDTVVDNGRALLLSGAWHGRKLQVLLRRVGDIDPLTHLE